MFQNLIIIIMIVIVIIIIIIIIINEREPREGGTYMLRTGI